VLTSPPFALLACPGAVPAAAVHTHSFPHMPLAA